MCDLVCDRYPVLQVMSRFGIALGFGDKTIAEVCGENRVDTATFLAVVNLVLDFGGEADAGVSVRALTDYLHNSHGYFLDFRLPAIRRKLIEAVDCSLSDVSFAIMRFFDEYVAEVQRHMTYEEQTVFPYVESLLSGEKKRRLFDRYLPPSARPGRGQAARTEEHHHQILPLGRYERTQRCAFRHLHLRAGARLAQCRRGRDLHSGRRASGGDGVREEKPEPLSAREREIIVCVVKGMTNKQIADTLCISTHTVITHRRNIAAKLQIHSAAGLTIYAIVNKLVELSEIKDTITQEG